MSGVTIVRTIVGSDGPFCCVFVPYISEQ